MTQDGCRYLLALLAAPAVVLATHALLARLVRLATGRDSGQGTALCSAALGLPAMAALGWASRLGHIQGPQRLWEAAYGLLVYGLLSYSYFHLYNISETSRRLRILQEVWSGAGDRAALEGSCAPGDQVAVRLTRLTDMGELRQEGDRYLLASRRLLAAALVLDAWGRVLGFGDAGPRDE